MPTKICVGYGCCWTGIDCSNCKCGYGKKGDCLCLTGEFCCACDEPSLGCGCVTNEDNKECCKLGLICTTCGLKSPDKLCSEVSYCFCMKSALSCPFSKGFVEDCTCAVFFISCAPECGCCMNSRGDEALKNPLKDYSFLTVTEKEEDAVQSESMER